MQVKALKEKIESAKGKDNFPVNGLKLIYAGVLNSFAMMMFKVLSLKPDLFIAIF